MTIYNPNREERAFLYQEAQDIEPLIKELGSLTVMIEEVSKTDASALNRFRVTFMVAPESVGMRVQATNADLFSATIAAKQEALRQLNAIVNSLPRTAQGNGPDVRPPDGMLH